MEIIEESRVRINVTPENIVEFVNDAKRKDVVRDSIKRHNRIAKGKGEESKKSKEAIEEIKKHKDIRKRFEVAQSYNKKRKKVKFVDNPTEAKYEYARRRLRGARKDYWKKIQKK